MANPAEALHCRNNTAPRNDLRLRNADQISPYLLFNSKRGLIFGIGLISLLTSFLNSPRNTDASQQDTSPVSESNSGTEPGYQHTHLLITHGEIEGIKTRCVLDTGATTSLVDNSLTAEFSGRDQQVLDVQLTSARKKLASYDGISVAYANLAPKQTTVIAVDLTAAKYALGQEINAIIGMDLLGSRVLLLGGTAPKFVDSLPDSISGYSQFPLLIRSARPALPLELPLVGTRHFIVDTGSNGCLSIDTKLADILIHSGHAFEREQTVKVDADGFCADRKLIIKEIVLLGVRFENILASVSEMNLIGMPLLMQFDMAFDFPQQRCFVGDTSKVDTTPYMPDASGLGLTFLSASSLEVRHVEPDSPAEAAGLRVGDQALAINDCLPSELTRDSLFQILSRDGEVVRIKVRRGDESIDVNMLLKRSFEYPPRWPDSPSSNAEFLESLNLEK